MDRPLIARAACVAALCSLVAVVARAALPPAPGGVLVLPAPEPLNPIDPTLASTHFAATIGDAVYDGLYEVRDGAIEPVLALGMPEVRDTIAIVRLRPGAMHHAGREVAASTVVRSLRRAAAAPRCSWLFGAFAQIDGRPAIREIDRSTVEFTLARPTVRAERVLAATSLAIVIGGSLGSRPIGTGPFHARLDRSALELHRFRHAPDRAPWLNRVRFVPPTARDEEVRAFELGRIDGSWWARSLYGGEPVRPTATTIAAASAPVLLVPNRARVADDRWGAVARAIARQRLERVGLIAHTSLAPSLPAPELPTAAPSLHGVTLRMIVRETSALETRLAEALAAQLDERGARLHVERVPDARYESTAQRAQWDLRLAIVQPPLPDHAALVGAAFAAIGQIDRARAISVALDDEEAAVAAARTMHAAVLGHERVVLHHRADLVGVRFDALGRIPLADLSFARPPVEAP